MNNNINNIKQINNNNNNNNKSNLILKNYYKIPNKNYILMQLRMLIKKSIKMNNN